MDKNILTVLCALTLIITSSCEKIIEIKADPIPPVLIINGAVSTTDSTLIHLFSTDSMPQDFWPIDSGIISQANVFIVNQYGDQEQLIFSNRHSGYLGRPRTAGEKLILRISHNNYPKISSQTTVPEAPHNFSATQTLTFEEENEGYKEYRVDFDFTYKSQPSYILGEVQTKHQYTSGVWPLYDTITTYFNKYLYTFDARAFAVVDPIEEMDGTRNLGQKAYIENAGNQDRVQISLYWDEHSSGESEQEMYASISILSEEAYRFFTQAILQDYTKYNPFASAVNVQGNVENGYGIFYAVNKSRVKL